jgi:DNA-binding beta-propeller fold protein YncE
MTTQQTSSQVTLEYIKTIGIVNNGLNGRGFANPYDLAISSDGTIYVINRCDTARAAAIRVGILNFDEDYLGEFGYGNGSGDGQFVWAVSMRLDSQERLLITDEYNHRISIFDTSGKFLSKWGTPGSAPGELNGPAGIDIDSDDNVYIVDQHNSRIQKFTIDGKYITHWGEFGSAPGQLNLPWGLSLGPDGSVYVADWRNDRIQKFSPEGDVLAVYGETGDGDGQFSRPAGLTVDTDGVIYVADWGNERVQVLNPDGSFALKLRGQATVSKWAEDYFASNPEELETREMSNLTPVLPKHLRSAYHESSQSEPYFWGPVAVRLDNKGRLYVSEANRHRLQIYQRTDIQID